MGSIERGKVDDQVFDAPVDQEFGCLAGEIGRCGVRVVTANFARVIGKCADYDCARLCWRSSAIGARARAG